MFTLKRISHSNALLDYFLLESKNVSAEIFPNLGASLQQLNLNGAEIIKGIDAQESDVAHYQKMYPSSFLFPFPGRIAGGTYYFDDTKYQLPTNEGKRDNAIHGLIADKSFELIHQELEGSTAKLNFRYQYDGHEAGFPFPFDITIQYEISESSLNVCFHLVNTGTKNFPFGIGWHPYFRVENLSECVLNFQSDEQLKGDENQIPIGTEPIQFQSKIGNQILDDTYVQKDPVTEFISQKYRFTMHAEGSEKDFLQIFTPPQRTSIAIEPMTCAPDVFNNKNGLLTLSASETFDWCISMNFDMI